MSENNTDAPEFSTDENTSTDSSTENKQEENTGSSSETSQPKDQANAEFDKLPLDQHPRWQERERTWNKKFEEQDQKWQTQLDEIKSASKGDVSGQKIEQNAEIPEWFGGDAKQWESFKSFYNIGIQQAEERAFQRLNSTQSAEKKAVDDANAWFDESVTTIEKDFGKQIDRQALLKVVLENELIDSKGRWNYKAGWQILKAQQGQGNNTDRKKLADATTKDHGKGDGDSKTVKTSEDFKKERPW